MTSSQPHSASNPCRAGDDSTPGRGRQHAGGPGTTARQAGDDSVPRRGAGSRAQAPANGNG
ncbi:hypothetical protein EV382_5511 [Micromonospora violae]|uniref:Uncharacterized protein n=1 Tax=Micromonospora violae TaxID=1278207 RepID=A0A4Q7UNR3_9ACTN|nr:hypothetical protein EV382_5511 [Micromonospora violae]